MLEASSHNPEIILLDLGLPDVDGVEVIHKVRSWSNVPIISSAPGARIQIKSKPWTLAPMIT